MNKCHSKTKALALCIYPLKVHGTLDIGYSIARQFFVGKNQRYVSYVYWWIKKEYFSLCLKVLIFLQNSKSRYLSKRFSLKLNIWEKCAKWSKVSNSCSFWGLEIIFLFTNRLVDHLSSSRYVMGIRTHCVCVCLTVTLLMNNECLIVGNPHFPLPKT